MEMDINHNAELVLKKVFVPIALECDGGRTFRICMRDDGIEVTERRKGKLGMEVTKF